MGGDIDQRWQEGYDKGLEDGRRTELLADLRHRLQHHRSEYVRDIPTLEIDAVCRGFDVVVGVIDALTQER